MGHSLLGVWTHNTEDTLETFFPLETCLRLSKHWPLVFRSCDFLKKKKTQGGVCSHNTWHTSEVFSTEQYELHSVDCLCQCLESSPNSQVSWSSRSTLFGRGRRSTEHLSCCIPCNSDNLKTLHYMCKRFGIKTHKDTSRCHLTYNWKFLVGEYAVRTLLTYIPIIPFETLVGIEYRVKV